jgi:hypothetical protein
MSEFRQVYRVELVVREDEGDQHMDEIDVERLITGEIDWKERIVSVHAEKMEEAASKETAHYVGPTP